MIFKGIPRSGQEYCNSRIQLIERMLKWINGELDFMHWIFAQNMTLVVEILCYSSFHSVGCLLGLWSIDALFRNYTRAYYTRLRRCYMYGICHNLYTVCPFPTLLVHEAGNIRIVQ